MSQQMNQPSRTAKATNEKRNHFVTTSSGGGSPSANGSSLKEESNERERNHNRRNTTIVRGTNKYDVAQNKIYIYKLPHIGRKQVIVFDMITIIIIMSSRLMWLKTI